VDTGAFARFIKENAMNHAIHPIFARLAFSGALLVAVGACTVPRSGSQNSYKGKEGQLEIERIEGNRLLASNLQLVNPISKIVDGRKIVQVELQNKLSSTQRFAWAVDWLDEDGFKINDNQRVFQPVALGGYGSEYITFSAPRVGEKLQWKLVISAPNEIN
jgi:hypothetical protein